MTFTFFFTNLTLRLLACIVIIPIGYIISNNTECDDFFVGYFTGSCVCGVMKIIDLLV